MENQDSFTEVSTESWGSRIMGSIGSVLFGIVLFMASFAVLWWNEGRAVKTSRGLEEGGNAVIEADASLINENNSGKLVHLMGMASTDELLIDEGFGIEVNALKLRRKVEMYQWIEEKEQKKEKKLGGGKKTTTTYNYKKVWKSSLINSGDFRITEGHVNPTQFPIEGYTKQAANASIGEYTLPPSMIGSLGNYKPYSVQYLDSVKFKNASLFNESSGRSSNNVPVQKAYIGKGSISDPQIGDIKVSFDVITSDQQYSLIAKQIGNTFERYNTSTGTSIAMIVPGAVSAVNMFQDAQDQNTLFTWILRLVGAGMMFLGIIMVFRPLVVIADVLPFLGSLLGTGISLFAIILTLAFSFVTIAIAWVYYRPVLGISLLAIGMVVMILFVIRSSKRKKLIVENQSG